MCKLNGSLRLAAAPCSGCVAWETTLYNQKTSPPQVFKSPLSILATHVLPKTPNPLPRVRELSRKKCHEANTGETIHHGKGTRTLAQSRCRPWSRHSSPTRNTTQLPERPKPPIHYRRANFDFRLRLVILIKISTQGAVVDWCALPCSPF